MHRRRIATCRDAGGAARNARKLPPRPRARALQACSACAHASRNEGYGGPAGRSSILWALARSASGKQGREPPLARSDRPAALAHHITRGTDTVARRKKSHRLDHWLITGTAASYLWCTATTTPPTGRSARARQAARWRDLARVLRHRLVRGRTRGGRRPRLYVRLVAAAGQLPLTCSLASRAVGSRYA